MANVVDTQILIRKEARVLGQKARKILAGGIAEQVAVHARVVAEKRLSDAAVEQMGAEEIQSFRFFPEGFGVHRLSICRAGGGWQVYPAASLWRG